MFIEYTYLVPLIPMLCFLIIGLAGRKTPQKGGYIAIAGALISFIIAALISYEYLTGDQYPNPVTQSIEWFSIGDITMHLGYYVDGLTCMMMLFSSFHLHPDLRVLHRIHGRGGTQEDEVLRRGLPVPDRNARTDRLQQLPGDVHLLGGHGTVLLPAYRILVLQAQR